MVLVPLDLLLSTICGQILFVACGHAFCNIQEIILTFFEVSLSSDFRNHTAKIDDAATTSKIDLSAHDDRPLLDPRTFICLRNALRP